MQNDITIGQLSRYGSRHGHPVNRRIHTITEPINMGLTLVILGQLNLGNMFLSLGFLVYLAIVVSVIRVHIVGGLIGSLLLGGIFYGLDLFLPNTWVLIGYVLAFIIANVFQQYVGHMVYEKKQPAYLTHHENLNKFASFWEGFSNGILYWPMMGLVRLPIYQSLRKQLVNAETELRTKDQTP